MEVVKLKAADYEAGLDFLDLVFSTAHGPMRFGEILPLCYRPTDKHMGHNFAVKEDGRIRGIVGLFPSDVKVGDVTLKLGGIGGVSAHPNDRGKGWMKLLMNCATREMECTGVDISFLIGQRQRYQYFGYEKAGAILEYTVNRTNIRHYFKNASEDAGLRLVPIESTDMAYIEKAKALHDAQPVHCVRPLEDFWLYLLSIHTTPWVALRSDDEAAGYLVVNEKRNCITEIFADSDEIFQEMIRCWLLQQDVQDTKVLLAPWQESFAHVLGAFAEGFRLTDNGNWRIFHWDRVVGSLLAVKNTQHALPEGALSVGIEGYGTLRITVSGGETACEKIDETPDLTWDTFTAMRVLFGHVPADFVTDIPKPTRRLCVAWFPLPLGWLVQNYV